MEKKNLVVAMVVLSTLFYAGLVMANVYVQPAKLGVLRLNETSYPVIKTGTLEVGNRFNESIFITLNGTDDLASYFEFPENNITLQANESKIITYILTIPAPGIYKTGVLLIISGAKGSASLAYDDELRVVANKIETEPNIDIDENIPFLLFAVAALVVVIVAVFVLKPRRKKPR